MAPHRFVPLEKDYSPAFIASCEVVAGMVELHRRDDVGYSSKAEMRSRGERPELRQDRMAKPDQRVPKKDSPSVMSSTSPLSPKH